MWLFYAERSQLPPKNPFAGATIAGVEELLPQLRALLNQVPHCRQGIPAEHYRFALRSMLKAPRNRLETGIIAWEFLQQLAPGATRNLTYRTLAETLSPSEWTAATGNEAYLAIYFRSNGDYDSQSRQLTLRVTAKVPHQRFGRTPPLTVETIRIERTDLPTPSLPIEISGSAENVSLTLEQTRHHGVLVLSDFDLPAGDWQVVCEGTLLKNHENLRWKTEPVRIDRK